MTETSVATPRLSASESWRLLEQQGVGRLSVTAADGMPDIFPVNFTSFQGALYIRTAPDVKVLAIRAHPFVAFEVDGDSDAGWWSVVVRGSAALIRDPVELEQSGVMRLVTASPRHKQHALKIVVNTITGRRFEHRGPAVVTAGAPTVSVEEPSEVVAELPRRTRPAEIPSRRPMGDR
jgi:nitroimidazol reductase NimA-like FMN-containing flavoprotein (pyridoxamine 5'-phosphate oxidase superfamily)